jgi:hypothetical protein
MLPWKAPEAAIATASTRIVFPNDPRAVLDVKRDLGAKGDGKTDDTEALQRAIELATTAQDHTRCIYLPAGIYRITRSLVFRPHAQEARVGSMVGPWIWGEERDRTIIRLDDRAEGFGDPTQPRPMIRGVPRPAGAKMNADFFDRTLVNLTLDAGDNPGAVGIEFYSNNTGVMRDVLVRGNGRVGIDLGSHDQNGPLLLQRVEISGFAIGVRTAHILNSQTLSEVTVRNARQVGVVVQGQVVAMERLQVTGAPIALDIGKHAVVAATDVILKGKGSGPAIRVAPDSNAVYLQRGAAEDFSETLAQGGHGPWQSASFIAVWTKGDVWGLQGTGESYAGWIAPLEPSIPYPTTHEEWVCANDFGAAVGHDITEPLQKAIDAAAARNATAVYLLGGKSGDPNWYYLRGHVRVYGSVRRLMGFGFVRILGESKVAGKTTIGSLLVEEGEGPIVLEHFKVFSPRNRLDVMVHSKRRPVVIRDFHGNIHAREGSTVFVANLSGQVEVEGNASVWVRQLNSEKSPEPNNRNAGGHLWILGLKTERFSPKVLTEANGRTEVLGVHNYNTTGADNETPFFEVHQAALSVSAYREVCFSGRWWRRTVYAKWDGQEWTLPAQPWRCWAWLRVGTSQKPVTNDR